MSQVVITRKAKTRDSKEDLEDQKNLFLPEYIEEYLETKTFFVSEEMLETETFVERLISDDK